MYRTGNRSHPTPPRAGAFSLVELMVAMSIAMIIIAAVLSSFTFLGRNLIRYSNQQQLEAQSRRALQMFSRDVQIALDVPAYSSTQLSLTVPKLDAAGNAVLDGSGNVVTKTVAYTFDASQGTLIRVDPDFHSGAPFTLLTGINLPAGTSFFSYLDQQAIPATNRLSIKQIDVNYVAFLGIASAGTQSRYTEASARFILRNKHLVAF